MKSDLRKLAFSFNKLYSSFDNVILNTGTSLSVNSNISAR